MFEDLNKMYQDVKERLDSKINSDEFRFSCDLEGKKLKDCVTEEFNTEESALIQEDPSRLFTKSVLECLDSGIALCIKQKDLKLEELMTEADFYLQKDDQGLLNINSIVIKMNPETTNTLVLNNIRSCLKFYETSCNKHAVKMPIKIAFEFAK
jgi:hypothetical protein